MARKKKAETPTVDVEYKTLEELTDGEFLKDADRLSFPFYLDYLSAPVEQHVSVDGYLSDTQIGIIAKNAQTRLTPTKKQVQEPEDKIKASQKGARYNARRVGCLVAIILISLLLLLISVLGTASPFLSKYIGLFKDGKTNVAELDPLLGLIDSLAKTNLTANYPYYATAQNAYELIPVYATSCAMILFLICTVIIFVKSLVALFEGPDKEGYFKRRTFGFLSVVCCLLAVIIYIGGMYMTGGDIVGIASYFNPLKGGVTAQFGVYAMIILPIPIAILSDLSYIEGINLQ